LELKCKSYERNKKNRKRKKKESEPTGPNPGPDGPLSALLRAVNTIRRSAAVSQREPATDTDFSFILSIF
jgi:hypothetical protein